MENISRRLKLSQQVRPFLIIVIRMFYFYFCKGFLIILLQTNKN
jgi:hypothetical protein